MIWINIEIKNAFHKATYLKESAPYISGASVYEINSYLITFSYMLFRNVVLHLKCVIYLAKVPD